MSHYARYGRDQRQLPGYQRDTSEIPDAMPEMRVGDRESSDGDRDSSDRGARDAPSTDLAAEKSAAGPKKAGLSAVDQNCPVTKRLSTTTSPLISRLAHPFTNRRIDGHGATLFAFRASPYAAPSMMRMRMHANMTIQPTYSGVCTRGTLGYVWCVAEGQDLQVLPRVAGGGVTVSRLVKE